MRFCLLLEQMLRKQLSDVKGQPKGVKAPSYWIAADPIRALVERLFAHPIFGPELRLQHEIQMKDGKRVYGEPWTADVWAKIECEVEGQLMAIVLNSDATLVSTFNGQTVHPVWATLANIPTLLRSRDDAKVLVGFLPTNSDVAPSKKMSQRKEFKDYMASCKKEAMRGIYDTLLQHSAPGKSASFCNSI